MKTFKFLMVVSVALAATPTFASVDRSGEMTKNELAKEKGIPAAFCPHAATALKKADLLNSYPGAPAAGASPALSLVHSEEPRT